MPDLTPDQRIDRDRRAKWVAFRRKHNMADDAPFVGECPWMETYQEMLDALNYLERVDPIIPGELSDVLSASSMVRTVARICLRNMKGGTE